MLQKRNCVAPLQRRRSYNVTMNVPLDRQRDKQAAPTLRAEDPPGAENAIRAGQTTNRWSGSVCPDDRFVAAGNYHRLLSGEQEDGETYRSSLPRGCARVASVRSDFGGSGIDLPRRPLAGTVRWSDSPSHRPGDDQ